MQSKPLRPLRSLREIYNHHTDVFFPHAEVAESAKNFKCMREVFSAFLA